MHCFYSPKQCNIPCCLPKDGFYYTSIYFFFCQLATYMLHPDPRNIYSEVNATVQWSLLLCPINKKLGKIHQQLLLPQLYWNQREPQVYHLIPMQSSFISVRCVQQMNFLLIGLLTLAPPNNAQNPFSCHMTQPALTRCFLIEIRSWATWSTSPLELCNSTAYAWKVNKSNSNLDKD